MEILMILVILGIGAGVKTALDHTADGYRQSRGKAVKAAEKKAAPKKLSKSKRALVTAHHGQGWWLGELFHGFPVARQGWHAGWLANKTAADHARALREEARTTQMETRASVLAGIPEHKKRQAEALKQIEGILTTEPNAQGKKAVRKAAEAVVLPFPDRPAPPLPAEVGKPEPGPYAPKPAGDLAGHLKAPMPDPRLNDRQRERDRTGKGNACAACGSPGTSDDPLVVAEDGYRIHRSHTTDASSGYFDPAAIDFNRPDYDLGADPRLPPDEAARAAQTALPESSPAPSPVATDAAYPPDWLPSPPSDGSPATNGNGAQPMPATDTTYTAVMNTARAALAQSDQDTASIRARKEQAYQTADEMVAAHVNPAVIDAQMSYADSLAKAEEALAGAGEHAGATASTLERYHGAVDQAVQDSPGQVAERQFHEGA